MNSIVTGGYLTKNGTEIQFFEVLPEFDKFAPND